MIIRLLKILTLTVIIVSCKEKPFSKIDFNKGEFKLFFYTQPTDTLILGNNNFYKKYKNFYVTDKQAIEKIINKVIQEKLNKKDNFNLHYVMRLIKDGEDIDGGIISLENQEIYYKNSKYRINLDELENLNNYFIGLRSLEFNCYTIKNINKTLSFIESINGFTYGNFDAVRKHFKEFNGTVVLSVDKEKINQNNDVKVIENRISQDFKKQGKIKLLTSSYKGGNEILIELLWENDFSKNLPDGYKMIKNYSDSIDMPLIVYNVGKEELQKFFANNGISDYIINEF
jgi:hypothetical protein